MAPARRVSHLSNAFLLVLSIGASLWVFPSLPEAIPRHFNLVGTADAYWAATLPHWLFLPLVGVALTGLMYGIAWIVAWSAPRTSGPSRAERASPDPSHVRRGIAGVQLYLYWTATGMLVLFGSLQWGVYRVATTSAEALPPIVRGTSVVVILGVLGGAVGLAWWRRTRLNGESDRDDEES